MWLIIIAVVIMGLMLLVEYFNKDNNDSDDNLEDNYKVQNHKDFNILVLLAFFIPLTGIIMGSIYMTKENELDKKLGITLLSISVLSSILFSLIWLLFVFQST